MYSEEDYLKSIIPHRLNMIEIMLFAMTEMRQAIEPKKMMVYVDDKLCFKGLETAFTNPAIEAGIINCRAMFDFLGLELKKGNLVTRSSRKHPDQKYIEDFKCADMPLEKVTPEKVRRLSKTDGEKGVEAIARLLQIANKEVAHITNGRSDENDRTDFDHLVIAAKGIRALTVSYFYTPLRLFPPENLIKQISKETM